MKPQTASTNGNAHVAPACVIVILFLSSVSPSLAQNYAIVQHHRYFALAGEGLTADMPASSVEADEDEFQAELAPTEEISSNKMAGKPAGTLPCEALGGFQESDTILSAPRATPAPSEVEATSAETDPFLVGEIQTVQRMIRLMKLKEEIMLHKARFAQELADLQQKIANQ